MSRLAKKQSSASPKVPVAGARPSTHPAADSKTEKADTGSKQSRVISMLQSPTGATIDAMMKVTGWQKHSVRGFLAGVVNKRLKLKLDSKKVDGTRIYQIASVGKTKAGRRRPKTRSR